jgi:TrmH family RNA methyltransferase
MPAAHPFVLVLAGLQIPGNVGTLVRAAVAAGAGAVVCVGGADPTSPKVVRAAAGCTFSVDLVVDPSLDASLEHLRGAGYRIAAATVHEGEPYTAADLGAPVALVLGSEAHGVDPEALHPDDLRVTVPMAGPAESLNVAMAGTLLCFEVLRREGTVPAAEA